LEETSPLTGTLLGGRYRVGAMLGAGGMGAVYEGVQEGLDRRVALKVLHPHLAGEQELLGRFQREAHVVAGLGHPNVVQISDFQSPPGEPPFLVMELLRGENLREALKRTPQLPQARVAYIAMQVLSALDAAHRANVVHRDIKPDNIFLERTNVQADIVKVLDFGVAKLIGGEEESANKLTRQGFVVGTLAYMAPEQASGEGVDGRSDLYALGACMYVASAGRKPFEAPTTTELLRAMLSEPPVPLTAIRQDVDDAFWQVIARALAKKKEDRFASAAEMARALAPFARPTTLEVPISFKTLEPSDTGPVPTQPTAAQTPAALGSEPTPAPATLPDDSGQTPPLTAAPHTAPLPTRPIEPPVPVTVPITQPMTAMEIPRFEQTARITPPAGIAATVQPLMHQASPAPVAVAPAATPRSTSRPWLLAGVAVLVLGAGVAVTLLALFERPAPAASAVRSVAPAPSATASMRVEATSDVPPLLPALSAPPAEAKPEPKPHSTSTAHALGAPAPRSTATTITTAIAPAPTSAPASAPAGHEPLVCNVARQMHAHGQTAAATRLAAQCVAQGGVAPF
jgi:serine/threonine protein kinase